MMHELVVHAICCLLISFNNYDYDCHMNILIFEHLFDTLDLNFQYFINEYVVNVKIVVLF